MWVPGTNFLPGFPDFSGGSVSAVIPGCVGIWQNLSPINEGGIGESGYTLFLSTGTSWWSFAFYSLGRYSQGAIL